MRRPDPLWVILPVLVGLFGPTGTISAVFASDKQPEEMVLTAHQVTRGPLHEAFASPLPHHGPRRPIPHLPPAPADEPIPVFRPQGDPIWIPGYWFFEDETQSFLWVGGVWRHAPEGRQWIPGFWKAKNGSAAWYPGFWAVTQTEDLIVPLPPPPRDQMVPAGPPEKDRVACAGHWVWNGFQFLWTPGTWTRISPGFVWIPPHHVPLPGGSRIISGYWDYQMSLRGLASCPSRIPPVAQRGKQSPRIVVEPVWFLRPEMIRPHLFIQNQSDHYLFGDYYSPLFQKLGIQSWFEYSRNHLDPEFSLFRALHRDEKNWEIQTYRNLLDIQMGQGARPPREILISENGEIPPTSLAAPAELALSELRMGGKILDGAAAYGVLNQRVVFLAMVRDREQKDEAHLGKPTLTGNLPQLRVDNGLNKSGNLAVSGLNSQGVKAGPTVTRLAYLGKKLTPISPKNRNGYSDQGNSPLPLPPPGNRRIVIPRASNDSPQTTPQN